MVLDATLSRNDAARLLHISIADLAMRVRAGELSCSELGAVRVGWRSLAAALSRDLADNQGQLKRALLDLQTVRAGLTPAAAEPGDSSPMSALTDANPERSDSAAIRETTERLALLLEAGRSVGGGEHLSRVAFDTWAARNGLSLTAAALAGEHGRWNVAKTKAGLAVREKRRPRPASNEALLVFLRSAADKAGDRLTMAEFDAFCAGSEVDADAALVASRFGSWNHAKANAGLELRRRGYQRETGPTDPYRDLNRPTEA